MTRARMGVRGSDPNQIDGLRARCRAYESERLQGVTVIGDTQGRLKQ